MCCLWDLNPIFTRRREAVKGKGVPRGSHPHGLRPICRWLGAWILAIGLMPGGTSLYPLSPRSSDNRLTGLGTRACTACQHGSVKETVCLRYAMTLSRYPGAHYTRVTRSEPTWISIVDDMTEVCHYHPCHCLSPRTLSARVFTGEWVFLAGLSR
jgi:hypothetical protein